MRNLFILILVFCTGFSTLYARVNQTDNVAQPVQQDNGQFVLAAEQARLNGPGAGQVFTVDQENKLEQWLDTSNSLQWTFDITTPQQFWVKLVTPPPDSNYHEKHVVSVDVANWHVESAVNYEEVIFDGTQQKHISTLGRVILNKPIEYTLKLGAKHINRSSGGLDMYALILEPLYSAPDDIDDPKADWRNVSTGNIIPDKNYCDQPYVVKTDDNAWLCIMTTGSGHEGQEGQHIITIRSTDFGQSWSEPVNVEPPDGPEASYAVLLKAPNGRIFAFYNHNTDNIRKVKGYYDSGYTRRVDSQGYFVFKYSDDHGKSWSDQRYTIPIRNMDIDRKNPYQGDIQYFWNVGKPFIHNGAAYVSVHKVGGYGYGFFTRSEGVLLKSTNLLTVSDPERASWETLPEGEFGIRAPDGAGPIAEEQSYVVLDDGSFFTVFRTISGHPGCAYSRDGGYSWEPSKFMQYATGRLMKHPRAANFVWKCDNGNYLYWFHNNGHMYYNSGYSGGSRNVAWLCGGIEKDGRIYWSQPEVILYEDDHLKGPSYPDFIEDEGRYFITETQKFEARVHELDANWVEGLWKQFTRSELTTAGLVLELDQNELKEKHVFQAPVLPAVSGSVDRSVRMYTAKGRGGFTFDMNICLHDFEPGQIVLDTRKPSGRGIWVTTTHQQTLRFEMCDGWSTAAWECDKGLLEPNVDHHVTIIVDGGPKIISFVIDGILNDGGEQRPLGWGRFSHHLKDANGSVNLKVGPHLNGQVKTLRVYDRAIRVTEAIGNFRYDRKAAE